MKLHVDFSSLKKKEVLSKKGFWDVRFRVSARSTVAG
jgi:hypothetical protein